MFLSLQTKICRLTDVLRSPTSMWIPFLTRSLLGDLGPISLHVCLRLSSTLCPVRW